MKLTCRSNTTYAFTISRSVFSPRPLVAALGLGLTLMAAPVRAETVPDRLDLSDCRILAGKRYAKAFKQIESDYQQAAKNGDLEARKGLAAIANNRFACVLENISEDGGWTIITSDAKNPQNSVATTTTKTNGSAVSADPQAVKTLREAYRQTRGLADEDVPYRQLAAGYVADYPDVFPKEQAEGYRLALGVQHIACRSPKLIGKDANNTFCLRAKAQVATLFPLLTPQQRARQEELALAWANAFADKRGGTH